MTVKLAAATADAMTDARAARMTSGEIEIRSGSQPSTADSAATGTLLATLSFDSTPVAGSSGGSADFNDLPLSVTAAATGTAGHYRIKTSADATVEDGACGEEGSGADMILGTTDLVSGVAVTLTLGSLAQPLS